MSAVLDFAGFSATEKSQLLTAAKAELLRRAGLGAVANGSATGQSFGMQKMTEDGLIRLINGLTSSLGIVDAGGVTQTRPNFSGCY